MVEANNPPAEKILLVDDDTTSLQCLVKSLSGLGHKIFVATNGERALAVAQSSHPTLALLDIVMPGGPDGFEVCKALRANPQTKDVAVIFLTALNDVDVKVRGFELGAVDFITKPFQTDEVVARVNAQVTIQRLRRELRRRNAEVESELAVARELVMEANHRVAGPLLGDSESAHTLRGAISNLANQDVPVLIAGVPGSGQEAVARAIHLQSHRRARPFLYLNCTSLSVEHAIKYFGDPAREAGTEPDDATAPQPIAIATGGTIYLDQIHRLHGAFQRRLAEILTAQRTQRASNAQAMAEFRLIACSYCNFEDEISAGRLDRSLYDELRQHVLVVPSLIERRQDIPVLAQYFAQEQARQLGKVVDGVSADSIAAMMSYEWPGSVQELKSLMERQVSATQDSMVRIDVQQLQGPSLGGYRLIEKLSEGGMGEVWRATHQLLARPAAVKLVRTQEGDAEQVRRLLLRFEREARVTANLHSPNTVSLYDFGVEESTGELYYVMELLRGLDLGQLVGRFGRVPPARVVDILMQCCRSLAEAHDAGLVHRDIKPANLFLCRLGLELDVVKVLDFGVVKGGGRGGDQTTLTGDGFKFVGTPGYISPEAYKQLPLDGRSDLYALGCVGYFLLTGRGVFESQNPLGLMAKHLADAPTPPSKVCSAIPPDLESLVMACLSKQPDHRPASAASLWDALEPLSSRYPWKRSDARDWWERNLPELLAPISPSTDGPTRVMALDPVSTTESNSST